MKRVSVADCLTAEEARHRLQYDPTTGEMKWKNPASSKCKIGDIAGSKRADGYWKVRINYTRYYVHRLAWLMHYGHWPEGEIDHINHDPSDNRIENLRDVSGAENHKNLSAYRCNTSGIPGIHLSEAGTWRARVYHNKSLHHAGSHFCLGRAIASLNDVKRSLGFHSNHGQQKAA